MLVETQLFLHDQLCDLLHNRLPHLHEVHHFGVRLVKLVCWEDLRCVVLIEGVYDHSVLVVLGDLRCQDEAETLDDLLELKERRLLVGFLQLSELISPLFQQDVVTHPEETVQVEQQHQVLGYH